MISREKKPPFSYDVFDAVLHRGEAKELARRLSRSPEHIRTWCRAPETTEEYATGKFNPLDRLRTLIDMIKEADHGDPSRAYPVGHYVAHLMQGIFIQAPPVCKSSNSEFFQHLGAILKETGEAVEAARSAWCESSPSKITRSELIKIRQEAEQGIAALYSLIVWAEDQNGGR